MKESPGFEEIPRPIPDREGRRTAEWIAVGDDLLAGTPDRTGDWLAGRIANAGGEVRRRTIVSDRTEAVAVALREALDRTPHLVVVAGGLGGAEDDRTLEGVAEALARPLREDDRIREWVEDRFARLHRRKKVASGGLTAAREKLFRIPVGFTPVLEADDAGCGAYHRLAGGTGVLCLPGDPARARGVLEAALPLMGDVFPAEHRATREVEAPTADETELVEMLRTLRSEHPKVRATSRPPDARTGGRASVVLEVRGPREESESTVESAFRRLLALAAGVR